MCKIYIKNVRKNYGKSLFLNFTQVLDKKKEVQDWCVNVYKFYISSSCIHANVVDVDTTDVMKYVTFSYEMEWE